MVSLCRGIRRIWREKRKGKGEREGKRDKRTRWKRGEGMVGEGRAERRREGKREWGTEGRGEGVEDEYWEAGRG